MCHTSKNSKEIWYLCLRLIKTWENQPWNNGRLGVEVFKNLLNFTIDKKYLPQQHVWVATRFIKVIKDGHQAKWTWKFYHSKCQKYDWKSSFDVMLQDSAKYSKKTFTQQLIT